MTIEKSDVTVTG